MKYGKSITTNVAISPQFLTKMANDSDLEDEYIKEIGNMKKLDEQFAKQQADIGWRVEQGWAIDKDGNISSWAIGHKDSKVKSFLQNMSEKAEEILQKQLEKSSASQKEYLEKLQEKKAEEKKEAKKKEQSKQIEVRKTTVQANSKEELLDKIKNIDWDSTKPEENKIGGRFNFLV